MNNIVELGYPLLRYNYVIVFFAAIILIYFFSVVLIKLFDDRVDFNNILEISDKIYVKFDYNGIIIDCNSQFKKIASIGSEKVKEQDIFDLIEFEDYDNLVKSLFDDTNGHYITNIICKNGDIKKYELSGIKNTNFFGAGTTYLVIGTDITAEEYRRKESEYNKQLLETLTIDSRFAEEEMKRNFDQIQSNKVVIEDLKSRHNFFVNTLPIGVIEFDFFTRQLLFSPYVIKKFLPNVNVDSVHTDQVLLVISNALAKGAIYDILESFYTALNNNETHFLMSIHLASQQKPIIGEVYIYYKNNEPEYMFVILNSNNSF